MLGGLLGSGIIKDGNPFAVHFVMFVPTILGQGTLEQQGEWLGRAWNMEIVGTYAQVSLFFDFIRLWEPFEIHLVIYLYYRQNLGMALSFEV